MFSLAFRRPPPPPSDKDEEDDEGEEGEGRTEHASAAAPRGISDPNPPPPRLPPSPAAETSALQTRTLKGGGDEGGGSEEEEEEEEEEEGEEEEGEEATQRAATCLAVGARSTKSQPPPACPRPSPPPPLYRISPGASSASGLLLLLLQLLLLLLLLLAAEEEAEEPALGIGSPGTAASSAARRDDDDDDDDDEEEEEEEEEAVAAEEEGEATSRKRSKKAVEKGASADDAGRPKPKSRKNKRPNFEVDVTSQGRGATNRPQAKIHIYDAPVATVAKPVHPSRKADSKKGFVSTLKQVLPLCISVECIERLFQMHDDGELTWRNGKNIAVDLLFNVARGHDELLSSNGRVPCGSVYVELAAAVQGGWTEYEAAQEWMICDKRKEVFKAQWLEEINEPQRWAMTSFCERRRWLMYLDNFELFSGSVLYQHHSQYGSDKRKLE